MFCSNCGRENRDESKFCTGCGNPIRRINKEESSSRITREEYNYIEDESSQGKSRKGLFITLGVIAGVIAACFIGYSAIMATVGPKEDAPKPQIQGSNTGTTKKPGNTTNNATNNTTDSNSSNSSSQINLAAKNNPNEYIARDSNVKLLTESDLQGLSRDDLGLIRNEIYARYGYVFKNATYADYFGSKNWYTPNSSFKGNESDINSVERDNIALIKSFEGM